VKSALENAFGGVPEQVASRYEDSSLKGHLNTFPPQARVCLIEAGEDTVVPIKQQKQAARLLSSRGVSLKVIEIPGNHLPPPGKLIVTAMDFVLARDGWQKTCLRH
jgi:hypothetical protein